MFSHVSGSGKIDRTQGQNETARDERTERPLQTSEGRAQESSGGFQISSRETSGIKSSFDSNDVHVSFVEFKSSGLMPLETFVTKYFGLDRKHEMILLQRSF